MPLKKYTHLFFDLDNTLWDFNYNSFNALYATLDKLKLLETVGSFDGFYKIYSEENENLWNLYRKGLVSKKILVVQRFEASFERNGTPLKFGGGILNDTYLEEMVNQTKLIDGATKVLDYLHGHYRMAIITNGFREVQYSKIDKSELSGYFTKIFVSEEIGIPKPGRKIFEHALSSMNAPKKSSLMIGDSWEADIVGAKKFGIDQIYFNPKLQDSVSAGSVNMAFDNNYDHIILNAPSISPPLAGQTRNIKNSTSFISHLEQLLIIL